MAELKTKVNNNSVTEFLNSLENEKKRYDSFKILELMQDIIGEEPKMWGNSIIGFGNYHYVYESGREGDWPIVGFSPRKNNLSIYIMAGFSQYDELMSRLGKYKTGKSCLYIQKLEDIEQGVLKELIKQSVNYISSKYENNLAPV